MIKIKSLEKIRVVKLLRPLLKDPRKFQISQCNNSMRMSQSLKPKHRNRNMKYCRLSKLKKNLAIIK
jgi:hypothetical protein